MYRTIVILLGVTCNQSKSHCSCDLLEGPLWTGEPLRERVERIVFRRGTSATSGEPCCCHLGFREFPCADVPGRWRPTAPVWSFLQSWQSSDSGSQTESRAHGSPTPATAGSTCHCLGSRQKETRNDTVKWEWLIISGQTNVRSLFCTFVVSSYKAQDVFMAEHDGLIDLSLTEPGALLSGWEDLHGHVTTPPTASPHLPETPFADDLLEDNCSGHGPLDKQRQPCSERNRTVISAFLKRIGSQSVNQCNLQHECWPAATLTRCALTGAWTRRGQIVYEVLQGPVFGHVQVVTGGVHLQPLPVAVGPLVVLIQECAHQQQQTQQKQRPGNHSNELHQPPCPAWAVSSPETCWRPHWKDSSGTFELNIWHW